MAQLIVEIEQGKLQGREAIAVTGNTYRSFQGIPYAKPPIGERRFKAPEPAVPWSEKVFDATKERDPCYAKHMVTNEIIGSEDCLFLNVYTPKISSEDQKLAVMFWIHGGGFIFGSSRADIYGPDYLISKNIILVTINYRLGFLGFLRLEDASLGVTGNAGLKDQVEALRWVQKNISQFGGDPNNVTIFGESAGGASVDLLKLSPQAKGLFHKSITQSGSALSPWTFAIRKDYELAKELGCTSSKDSEILKFLQAQKYQDIQKLQHRLIHPKEQYAGEINAITPVIEPKCPSAFLTDAPEDLLARGEFIDVPTIIGYNSDEGLLMCNPMIPTQLRPDFTNYGLLVPRDLREALETHEAIMEVGTKIKEYYYGSDDPSHEKLPNFVNYYTDEMFAYKIQSTALALVKNGRAPVYNFKFSLNTDINFTKLMVGLDLPGACHADDISYIFKCEKAPNSLPPNSPAANGIHVMTTLWTNFAKTGNPNPKSLDPLIPALWKPLTIEERAFLHIGDKVKADVDRENKMMTFWDGLYNTAKKQSGNFQKLLRTCKL